MSALAVGARGCLRNTSTEPLPLSTPRFCPTLGGGAVSFVFQSFHVHQHNPSPALRALFHVSLHLFHESSPLGGRAPPDTVPARCSPDTSKRCLSPTHFASPLTRRHRHHTRQYHRGRAPSMPYWVRFLTFGFLLQLPLVWTKKILQTPFYHQQMALPTCRHSLQCWGYMFPWTIGQLLLCKLLTERSSQTRIWV